MSEYKGSALEGQPITGENKKRSELAENLLCVAVLVPIIGYILYSIYRNLP